MHFNTLLHTFGDVLLKSESYSVLLFLLACGCFSELIICQYISLHVFVRSKTNEKWGQLDRKLRRIYIYIHFSSMNMCRSPPHTYTTKNDLPYSLDDRVIQIAYHNHDILEICRPIQYK